MGKTEDRGLAVKPMGEVSTQVNLITCGGFHAPEATQQLIADISRYPGGDRLLIHAHPAGAEQPHPLSPLAVRPLRLRCQAVTGPIIFLAFSAGCLAAASAARYWYTQQPERVLALFAVDGWGVPLAVPFPVHRLSHDRFTHLTSAGPGDHFYADPAVDHLRLWQRPSLVSGVATATRRSVTAAEFLSDRIAGYCQSITHSL